MTQQVLAILTGITLSLAVAVLLERVLFRGLLRLMFAGPRKLRRLAKPAAPNLNNIRNAGM
jgi:hypothetical protein